MSCYVWAACAGAPDQARGAAGLPAKLARYLSPFGAQAAAAALALARSLPGRAVPARVGVYTATGPSRFDPASLGARLSALDVSGPLWRDSLSGVDPFSLLKIMSCGPLAVLAMSLPARGPSAHFCDDALGGAAALAEARAALLRGDVEEALVLAFDDLSSEHAQAELARDQLRAAPASLAALYLSARPEGAIAQLDRVSITYTPHPEAPVGGGAVLEALVRALLAAPAYPARLTARAYDGEAVLHLAAP